MDEKKPSTADILAKIRAKKTVEGGAPAPTAAAVEAVPAAAAEPAATPVPTAHKPAATAAKPGSTKDILAAIRAKGAGTVAAAPVAEAAAPSAVAAATSAAVKPAAPAGPLPSIAEMVRAAKAGAPAATASAAAKPVAVAAPPMPAKPVPSTAKKAGAPTPARRSLAAFVLVSLSSLLCLIFGGITGSPLLVSGGILVWVTVLTPFALAWTALGAVTGISVLGTARFMFPNVLVEPPSKFKVGPASDYPLNTVSNKWKDQFGIWIVHTDQYEGKNLIYALSTVCTHLGCTPNWLDGEQKFKCPCHGSGFYITGVNFEGPAPRPLERMGISVAADNMLEVDKSVKFQEEMGQWTDPASRVEA